MFELHPQLAQDTLYLCDLSLCEIRLMNNATLPWFVLIPKRAGIHEVYQLNAKEQQQLWHETTTLSQAVKQTFAGDKLNIGALGNLVSQLHMHVVVRYTSDPAWPAPVWGNLPTQTYTSEEFEVVRNAVTTALNTHNFDLPTP
ncbi:histidine triad (HIT) protein [Arenicella chitinivorans]|uniref:Histidine triad (HIT) protein n=1 Tax=Arenicella chitinivorans TaxID=1329800 RepID=A0A918RSV5_9GAMM|nr:HIT family protein [Arenicella chitinivorans]GHA11548.1 histidine triad (HIT) protein [Arenicella chitinivorans]